jgi:hypothetical protein
MLMFSGKSRTFEKKNIDNDTLLLQESVVFQFLLLEIPQLVVKAGTHLLTYSLTDSVNHSLLV